MKGSRSAIPLVIAGLVAAGVVWWNLRTPPPSPPGPTARDSRDVDLPSGPATRPTTSVNPPPGPGAPPPLSPLADIPEWEQLNAWQSTVTRAEFLEQIEEVFTVSSAWRNWFHVGEGDVLIETGEDGERFRLRFAKPGLSKKNPRSWRTAEELGPAPEDLPLDGLRIAIDPGHIGGRWGKIEERWFQIGSAFPVMEGDMTLLVARILKPKLEQLGATVSMVRESTEPVTDYRPESLMDEARELDPNSPRLLAERLFYRTAEIRARADLVNRKLKPDLVLCLHFNAEAWGDANNPTLINRHHFHVILNGAYTDDEVALADQRFLMVRRIVEQTHAEEAAVSKSVATTFAAKSGLPPYLYEIDSKRAVNIGGNPYLWARNLLANRLYDRPVVFLEPYVMNSTEDYARIQAGDYEGERMVAGKLRPSIFREYADAVAEGLADHYRVARGK